VAGYSTGMSQPLKATIFAPILRWMVFSAVFRIVGALSTTDKKDLDQVADSTAGYDPTTVSRAFFHGQREVEENTGPERRVTGGLRKTRVLGPWRLAWRAAER
jgi:hypothetical protein